MAPRTDTFDLAGLKLSPGQGRRIDLTVPIAPFSFGGQDYVVTEREVPAVIDVSRMTGNGYSLRLRLTAHLQGPCMRCLADATPSFDVDAREVNQPGGDTDEMVSPYVQDEELDLTAWARDALALALPAQILCREDCAGLCPECGKDLNVEPHEHEKEPDPRWAALRELKF